MTVEIRRIIIRTGASDTTFESANRREVDALVAWPHMAVHRSARLGGGWAVTHVPTGLLMASTDDALVAMEAANALQRLAVNWNVDHPSMAQGFPESVREQVQGIRQASLDGDLARLRTVAPAAVEASADGPANVLAIGAEAAIWNCAHYLREEAGLPQAAEQMDAVGAAMAALSHAATSAALILFAAASRCADTGDQAQCEAFHLAGEALDGALARVGGAA